MFLSKTYSNLGGKYKTKKNTKNLVRWRDEKWVQIIPYLEKGVRIECGSGANKKACRPTIKIDE